ncbi:MAG: DegT/DnrJ/EryC1/StrS family aminotransferase [Candidatus Eisenbacteria bacterium]
MAAEKTAAEKAAGQKKVPLVDLKAQYAAIRPEIDEAIQKVLDTTGFVGGPELRAFEEEFARFCGANRAVGVSSGTSALHLALVAAGVGEGDEVVTVAHTFIATAEMIVRCGAKVVFCDIDPETATMSPADLERRITPRTKAILPVHLYGCPADMDPILEIARRRRIPVIEDAAQAHGARYRGRTAGSIAGIACFSFYPGKNLGAYGDGGAITCESAEVAERLQSLANHGRRDKYVHDEEGWNYRLDAMQAAILRVKLRHLDAWNEARRAAAARYDALLDSSVPGVRIYRYPDDRTPVYHLYVIRVPGDRDAVVARLKERGIDAGVHYPVPLHLQPAYAHLGVAKGSLPATEEAAASCLSLPIYPEITEEQIGRVVVGLREALAG